MTPHHSVLTADPWQCLRQLTQARIALGRAGTSLPTSELLGFGTAHAQARDAVHQALNISALAAELSAGGFAPCGVASQAADRSTYLRRPDFGRRLAAASVADLRRHRDELWPGGKRLAIVVADGLSALAISSHAAGFLAELQTQLPGLTQQPLIIATQARVALGDEIGQLLGVEMVLVLIGERPGLSSPDSLGLYLTAGPRPGLTDAERNCISNVRPAGLSYAEAAHKLTYLIEGARRLGRTGVDLKDDSGTPTLGADPLALLLPNVRLHKILHTPA